MLAERIKALLTDKGYDAKTIRTEIEAAGVEAVIPAKNNRRVPARHDRIKYRWCNHVERLFNKLKSWRRVATRYDKTKESYLGFVAIASTKLWMPFVHVPRMNKVLETIQFWGLRGSIHNNTLCQPIYQATM